MEWIFWFAIICIVLWWISYFFTKKKRERLAQKYESLDVADKLMNKVIWQGETMEQLMDSFGSPIDIEQTVLKTKTKVTWKYGKTGKNRYNLKIHLEDGEVTGWVQK